MRKILAILSSILVLYMVYRIIELFNATDIEVLKLRPILLIIDFSLIIPLIVLSIWLWRPKRKA